CTSSGTPAPCSRSHGAATIVLSATVGSWIPDTSFPAGTTETTSSLTPVRSSATLIRDGSPGPDDALELRVRVQAERPAVAADAAVLRAPERCLMVALDRVDTDVAGAKAAGGPHPAGRVAGEHVVVQPEVAVVGEGDGLLVVVERLDDDHGTE